MNIIYSKKGFYLALLAFVLWGAVSSYWYVCGIKNFCTNTEIVENKTEEIYADIREDEVIMEEAGDDILESEEIDNNIVFENNLLKKKVKKTYTCSLYLSENIKLGRKNNINEVAKLEKFLNDFEGEELVVDGKYSSIDKNAVIRMQNKYSNKDDNLGNNSNLADGVVGPNTRTKINKLYCTKKSQEELEKNN